MPYPCSHFMFYLATVFDQVLECFELQPDNNVFLELIPIFPKVISRLLLFQFPIFIGQVLYSGFISFLQSHASQILGFKFQYYQRVEVSGPVPFGLYKLTALLVKQDFIDLDSM